MIGLCDCNNFFVSCERVFRPDLNGRPVAVLSGNDGCIIARSNEVKALGIKMGAPLYQVKAIVQQHNVSLFSANHQLYSDMSQRVMLTLQEHVPSMEVYSIDEAFIDYGGFQIDTLQQRAVELSRIVRRNTGIPVSIGIAPTKTLAKIASRLCKKYPKLNGACLMYRPEDIEKVLRTLPIGDVWGIGRKYSKLLNDMGIQTAYDFTQRPSIQIDARMGISGVRTWKELRGDSCIELADTYTNQQSISTSRTFSKEMHTIEELNSVLTLFASNISSKLRKQGSCAGQITTFIYTNKHREDEPQRHENHQIKLSVPSDSTLEIIKMVTLSLKEIYRSGYGYKRAGITVSNLIPKNAVQSAIFDEVDRGKHSKLMQSIDKLNSDFGKSTILIASHSGYKINTNSRHISPNYTTDWDDILEVKI